MVLAATCIVAAGCTQEPPAPAETVRHQEKKPAPKPGIYRERQALALSEISFEKLAELPDAQVDIAAGSLLACRYLDPQVDIEKNVRIIDGMAKELARRLRNARTGADFARAFAAYFFAEKKFTHGLNDADRADMSEEELLELHRIDRVLKTKKGDCVTLSLLYLCMAERLGLPFYCTVIPSISIELPGHMFIEYFSEKEHFYIDPSANGEIVPKEDYQTYFKEHLEIYPDSLSLTLTPKQVLSCFARDMSAIIISKDGDLSVATGLLAEAEYLTPESWRLLFMYAIALLMLGERNEALEILEKAREMEKHSLPCNLALAQFHVLSGDYDEAHRIANDFLTQRERHPGAYLMKLVEKYTDARRESGWILSDLKSVEKGIAFVEEYRKKHPRAISPLEDRLLLELRVILAKREQELERRGE
jgi:regulator of sirC expression with transglutaminase-like and TPR domain